MNQNFIVIGGLSRLDYSAWRPISLIKSTFLSRFVKNWDLPVKKIGPWWLIISRPFSIILASLMAIGRKNILVLQFLIISIMNGWGRLRLVSRLYDGNHNVFFNHEWGVCLLACLQLLTPRLSEFGLIGTIHSISTRPISHYKYNEWFWKVEIWVHHVQWYSLGRSHCVDGVLLLVEIIEPKFWRESNIKHVNCTSHSYLNKLVSATKPSTSNIIRCTSKGGGEGQPGTGSSNLMVIQINIYTFKRVFACLMSI